MLVISHICLLVTAVMGQKLKGDNGDIGGLFGVDIFAAISTVSPNVLGGLMATGSESPKTNLFQGMSIMSGSTEGGTGPYKAQYTTDPSLPNHTIYAPKTPPKGIKMPVVLFANGLCLSIGTMYSAFLTEIASHGYVILANGVPNAGFGFAKLSQMAESIDWATKNEAAKKYGDIDPDKIAASGQSCGGLEAYSTSYQEPRIKLTIILNIGIFEEHRRPLIKELKAPVGWFLGGTKDAGTEFGTKDYALLSPGVPAVFASLDSGHMGTYAAPNGGKFGKAVVAFLEWQFRGNETAKQKFANPKAPDSLVSDRWNVTMKNTK